MILALMLSVESASSERLQTEAASDALLAVLPVVLLVAVACHLTCLARQVASKAERDVVWLAGFLFAVPAASVFLGPASLPFGIVCAAFASNAYLSLYRSGRS